MGAPREPPRPALVIIGWIGMTRLHSAPATRLELGRWAAAGELFAVIDAAGLPEVPERAAALGQERAVSLYRGQPEETLAAVAPYLFQVDGGLLQWIRARLWSEPWGIFVRSTEGLEALRIHFRRFLLVESPTGEEWYFRFYDPRVLPRFLRVAAADQLASIFGPVRCLGITDPDSYGTSLFFWGEQPVEVVVAEHATAGRVRFQRPSRPSVPIQPGE